jgi:hypothetical protein
VDFLKKIYVFKSNRNFGVFVIAILKTQILKNVRKSVISISSLKGAYLKKFRLKKYLRQYLPIWP